MLNIIFSGGLPSKVFKAIDSSTLFFFAAEQAELQQTKREINLKYWKRNREILSTVFYND